MEIRNNKDVEYEYINLLNGLAEGDVYVNPEGESGILHFGVYPSWVGEGDEYHLGYYIEYEYSTRKFPEITHSSLMSITTALEKGWRKKGEC